MERNAKKRDSEYENTKEETAEKIKEEDVNYDQLIQSAGEIGKYQMFLFVCTCPFYVFGVFSYFTQLFMTEVSPHHWCWIPELENLTITERRNLAIPLDETSTYGYSRCLAYQANWTEVLASGAGLDHTRKIVPCQNGWEFNNTEMPYPTISNELGWVCDKDSYQASAQAFYSVGSIIGGFLVGWVADRFGRLPAIIFSNMIGAVAGIATAFSQNFVQFVICRLVMGMSYDNCMIMVYLLVLEYISPKYRTLMANLSFAIFFCLAVVSLPWIALACGHWRTLALATSVPMLLSVLTPLIIPESPRWLLSKGRVNDTVNKIQRIAEVNKKDIPQDTIAKFKRHALANKEESGNVIDLIRRPLLRRTFLGSCLLFLFFTTTFDALIRTIGQLKFDFFVSFSVISATELPSLAILSVALDYTGRKFMMVMTMFIGAICTFMIPFVGAGLPSVVCAVIARFAVNMAGNTSMQWTPELLPTSVRGTGVAIVHICAYIATVISPFIAYLETYMAALPMIVTGCLMIATILVALVLPETANKEIPQTFEDAEDLSRNQECFPIPFLNKKKNIV